MADIKITRPENDSEFSQKNRDKNMMSYMVLFGVSQNEAYLLFHPDLTNLATKRITSEGAEECRQFFAKQTNKDYVKAFKETLNKRLSGLDLEIDSDTISDKRKDDAVKSLLDKIMTLVEGPGDLDPEILKIAGELFRKVGLLKDEVEQTEPPRRYLPVRCLSECQYRAFCEKAIENGEIENECLYCKALKIAQEHGYHYDPTTNLCIPKTDEVES